MKSSVMQYCFDIGDSFDCWRKCATRCMFYQYQCTLYIVYVFHSPECVTGSCALQLMFQSQLYLTFTCMKEQLHIRSMLSRVYTEVSGMLPTCQCNKSLHFTKTFYHYITKHVVDKNYVTLRLPVESKNVVRKNVTSTLPER